MIYLGEQINALNAYRKEAVCWLGVKLKSRNVYNCGQSSCYSCNNRNKRKRIDQDFSDLFDNDIINEIIIAKPEQLFQLNEDLENSYTSIPGKTLDGYKENAKKLFVNSGYIDWFTKDKKTGDKWNYRLARLLNKHTCTYCNKEYIFVYKNPSGEGRGMVPQFDHWFPKTDYPLLAISFYNLIPSCPTCNAIKSKTELNLDEHFHPYIDKKIANSYKFSYLPTSDVMNKIILKNNSIFNNKGIDTANALNLPLIYKGHSDKELQDLIDLRHKYSDNYLKILLEKTFGDLGISKQERYRLIFGIEIEEEEHHQRIFSKFKSDIIRELLSIE